MSLLGDIPFDAPTVESQDRGAPPVVEASAGPVARAFHGIAEAVAERIGAEAEAVGEAEEESAANV